MKTRTLLARGVAVLALSGAMLSPAFATGTTAATSTAAVGAYVDDAAITAKVKAALLKDKQASATSVNVTTEQGVVMLSGTVDTPDAGVRAIEIAAGIEGVKDVKSALTVKAS
ncbi:BON domain-containing protein [Chitiniphilus purpureus]|uniref:BON domain-containing protein n=1 Tax=Chitiniphilus purpureus TaxID=2981137 RepID=A0ABY6DL29_9NEIS|nr:BON domain-containing protein [Chitiniphilus sp. CD1]UXY14943.1 BON domain-containing protein [Chitiniphilus sp. CD1]